MALALEKIIDEIKALTPEQRQRIREMLDETPSGETPEEELRRREEQVNQRLYEKGILVKIPLEDVEHLPFEDYVPIKVEGKPLSETILEERR